MLIRIDGRRRGADLRIQLEPLSQGKRPGREPAMR